MKLLRTLRLDASDPQVFGRAAEPGEWASPGSFCFAGLSPATDLDTRQRLQLASGWLGLISGGWSTLVQVVEADMDQRAEAEAALTALLLHRFGAPDPATAQAAAAEELADSAAIAADHKVNTLLAIERGFNADGDLIERIRAIQPPREKTHTKIWELDPDS